MIIIESMNVCKGYMKRFNTLESMGKLPVTWELNRVSHCTAFAEVFVLVLKKTLLIDNNHSEYER